MFACLLRTVGYEVLVLRGAAGLAAAATACKTLCAVDGNCHFNPSITGRRKYNGVMVRKYIHAWQICDAGCARLVVPSCGTRG